MAAPTIEFLAYDAQTAGFSTCAAGSVLTLASVSAGSWTEGKAFRVRIKGNVGKPTFTLSTVRIWFNDTMARYNGATDVDLGDRYSASGTHHWSARLIQVAAEVTTGLVGVTALQTSVSTCPAAALTDGSWFLTANNSTNIFCFHNLAATFKGSTLANGVLLNMSTPSTVSAVYSRHLAVSFRPTPSAADGVYTAFGVEVGFDFT